MTACDGSKAAEQLHAVLQLLQQILRVAAPAADASALLSRMPRAALPHALPSFHMSDASSISCGAISGRTS
jgi:hypothetical protein